MGRPANCASVGSTFGSLTVTSEPFPQKRCGKQRSFVMCRCACGAEFEVLLARLRRGDASMCRRCAGVLGGLSNGARVAASLAERFWANVSKGPGCWEWTASCHSTGYGQIGVGRKNRGAHQVAWELTFGPIEKDPTKFRSVCVLHRCDNRKCCNPNHLFLGTHTDNMRDMVAKGRHVAPWMERRK
jgi:hypothetical protein